MGIFKQFSAAFKEAMATREHAAAGKPYTPTLPIAFYTVTYKGGLPEYPQSKVGGIDMEVFSDRIDLLPTLATKSWFAGLVLPYSAIVEVKIVERTLGTFEGIVGGLDSRQLNQKNNIHLTFETSTDAILTLRLEMLSGITVMGQASKCEELLDRLKSNRLTELFRCTPTPQLQDRSSADIPLQIERLAVLRDKGILSETEFSSKKAELLARM